MLLAKSNLYSQTNTRYICTIRTITRSSNIDIEYLAPAVCVSKSHLALCMSYFKVVASHTQNPRSTPYLPATNQPPSDSNTLYRCTQCIKPSDEKMAKITFFTMCICMSRSSTNPQPDTKKPPSESQQSDSPKSTA